MDPDDARAISDYLTRGIYPAGLSRDDKRSLRQKSTSFLVCDDGRLYHRGKEGRKQLVICDSAEKLKIINAMHTDRGGRSGHNGRNATLQRISLQYWWRHLVDDVRDYCKSCNDCIVRSKMPNQKYEIPIPSETVEDNVCSIESVCNVYNVELSSRSYASDLLSVLASFYNESVCCDVLLSAGRYQTRAHKVVLIAASGYFKSMLLDTDLPFNDTITLPHVSGVCLESLVSYFYSGSLKINETNIQAMCDAAMALDIPSALDLCKQFLNRSSEICLNREVELKYGCDEDPDDNDGSTDIYQSLDGQPAGKMKTEIKLLDEEEMMKQDFVLEDMTEAVAVSTESELPASKSSMKDDGKTRKPLLPAVNKDELPVKRKRGRPRKNSPQRSQPVTRCVTRSKSSSKLSKEGVRCKKAKLLRLDKVTLKSKNSVSPDCFYKNIKKLVSESGIYICEYCNLTFKFSVGLAHHQSKVHSISVSNTPLQRSRRLLLQRSVNHIILSSASVNGGTNSKRKCSLCSSEHRLISEVKTHFIKNHMYHYVCKIPGCFRKFISRRTLVQHKCCTHSQNKLLLRTNAETVDLSSVLPADEPFSISNKCGWCGMSFALRSELVEHRKMVHRKPKATTSEEVPLVKQRFILRDWNCREKGCNAMFKKKEKLKAHMAELHPSVLFTCPECRFKTQVEQILKRHLLRRHKERHMCQLCGKAYHKPFLLRVHMFNRHKMSDPLLKLYHCQHEGCDYACPSKNGMNLHILKHTSGNPFSCHVCGKSFKRAAGLDKHVNKIHLGIRPYICDKCGVSYGDESELRIHMGRHAENKPYTCDHCTYSTFQKGSLKSHLFCRHQVRMDQEMPVMKCEKCSFTTDKKCRFQDHIKMHNNIRDIPCHECGKMFVTKKTLRQHVIKVHRQKVLGCTHCSFTTALQSKLQEHVRMMHSLSQDVAKFIDMVPQQEEQQQIQQQQQQQQQILQQQLQQQQQQQQQLQIQQIHIPQQQLQDQSNCLTSLSLLPVTEYQTLLQMNSNQQMAAAADSAVIVNISMSLDSVSYPCFQTLDRSHLVM